LATTRLITSVALPGACAMTMRIGLPGQA